MTYRAPVSEMRFLLDHVLGAGRLAATERFAEATPETVEAMLGEAARLAEDVLAPLRRAGDLEPARLENGVVRTTPGFAEAYRALAEGGWVGHRRRPGARRHGAAGDAAHLPQRDVLGREPGAGALPAPDPGADRGAASTTRRDEVKARLPAEAGRRATWTGTMNLTEPQAGSDVGAVRTRAEPNGDGTYAVTGQKIFISWGDHDVAENVCHLVLARLPDGAPGTKGISLFLVPKFLPDADGRPGVANGVRALSLEHKMGLHGSPTCVMEFDGATRLADRRAAPGHGGDVHDDEQRPARRSASQGLAQADAALQAALAFAARAAAGADAGARAGDDHRPRRRAADADDHGGDGGDGAGDLPRLRAVDRHGARRPARRPGQARAAFLTPIAKAFGTDAGCEVSALAHAGLRRHGLRRGDRRRAVLPRRAGDGDLRGHQRHPGDGHGRPQARRRRRGGAGADRGGRGHGRQAAGDLGARLAAAARRLAEATGWMAAAEPNDRFAGAVPYLRAFALTLGGHYLLKAALAEGEDGPRAALAAFHIRQLLPQVTALCDAACEGAAPLYALELAS